MTVLDQVDATLEHSAIEQSSKRRWLRFFCFLLPVSLGGGALLCQILAFELRGIQPFRTYLDVIAVAAERVSGNARWLIFSDSTTQHVLMDYALGPSDVVANLTTHGGAGMPSAYLLLRRYLSTHRPPHAIILAFNPEMYLNAPAPQDAKFWLIPTFLEPEEQQWLSRFYDSTRRHGTVFAAADIKASILDPLSGLLMPTRDKLVVGPRQPSPTMPVESKIPPSPAAIESEKHRGSTHLELQSMPRAILTDICAMARRDGFTVHLIREPMAAAVREALENSGELSRLDTQVTNLMSSECGHFYQFDMASVVQPPNFDDGGTHIVGLGWENKYALALLDYIRSHDN